MKKRYLTGMVATALVLTACGAAGQSTDGGSVRQGEEGRPVADATLDGASPAGSNTAATDGKATTDTQDVLLPVSGAARNVTDGVETLALAESDPTETELEALSRASFSLLAGAMALDDADTNILISPSSVMMAFGMAENGAAGNTLDEMEMVMNGNIDIDEMNPLLYGMTQRFLSARDVKWNIANSIWFKDDGLWEVKADFAAKAASYYDADIWMAPFDDGTVEDINRWVSDETWGMIPDIIGALPPLARMVLVNAIAFEGEWQQEYEEADILEGRTFTNADGSEHEVTMLWSEEDRYFRLGDGIGFLRPYKGGEYSFVGILPDEGVSTADYIASLYDVSLIGQSTADVIAPAEQFADAIRHCSYGDVIVQIPEYELDYSLEMTELLKGLGMNLPFDEEKADFTEMMAPVTDDAYAIWIGSVLHKTHIEVDRVGTRAAAATAIILEANSDSIEEPEPPIVITLDRPFVYAIVENGTGLPVFLGCMNTME